MPIKELERAVTEDEAETLLDSTFEACARKGKFSEHHEACREVGRAGFRINRDLVFGVWHIIQ